MKTRAINTMKSQIIELYRQAVEPREIADRLCSPINSVARVICVHKRRTGEVIAPASRRPPAPYLPHEGNTWSLPADKRRMAFHARAVAAARQARMADA